MKNKIRNDIILFAALMVLSFTVFLILPKEKGENVEVYKNGELLTSWELKTDKEYELEELTVVTENGKAYVINADCPDKVCVNTAAIKNKGESIICVPAKIVVKIADSEFDAVI